MEKLNLSTLVRRMMDADSNLGVKETVTMLVEWLGIYSPGGGIKNKRGDDYHVDAKIASDLVRRKTNLPKIIREAARNAEIISKAQEWVEQDIRGKLSSASIPVIIRSLIPVIQNDPSIPAKKREEWMPLANEETFSLFFSEILVYCLQVDNKLEDAGEEAEKSSAPVVAADPLEVPSHNKFDKIAFEALDAKYKKRLWELIVAKFHEGSIFLQALCDVFYDKYRININIADLTRYFHEPDKQDIPLVLLWETCSLLGIPMNALFHSAEKDIALGNDSSQNFEAISPLDMAILTAGSKHLITNPLDNRVFHAYFGTYYTYFTPTDSGNSKILKGKLTFSDEGSFVHAHFELNVNQLDEHDNPIIKTYDGMLICSTNVDCCYCILSSATIGEMSFIMFRRLESNYQKLKCRMAMVLTSSAGSEDRNPTIHRMLLSREDIHDEDLAILLPFLYLTTSEITISQEEWEKLTHNNDIYSNIMREFREGHELKSILCYQLRENTIRSTFRDATQSREASPTPFISTIRSKAIAYRYNKVSRKVDKSLYGFLQKRGYFKRKHKT